jgi:hypothetical protein
MTWPQAFKTLQEALAVAQEEHLIKVAQETYTPSDTGDRSESFELAHLVQIHGGYAGNTENDPNERDIVAFETILSGDLNDDDGPGEFEDYSDNSIHVVVARSEDSSELHEMGELDGCTIRGGYADGSGDDGRGAGIFIGGDDGGDEASPVIKNCTIKENYAGGLGGGGGGAVLSHVQSEDPSAPEIRECLIQGNRTDGHGGGILSEHSDPKILACTPDARFEWGIVENEADDAKFGGGIAIVGVGAAIIVNCLIDGNEAGGGGGLGVEGPSDPAESTPLVVNCRITNNRSSLVGAGMLVEKATSSVLNATIVGNATEGDGGGYAEDNHGGAGPSTIVNSIIWGNEADGDGDQVYAKNFLGSGDPFLHISYSDVPNGEDDISDDDGMIIYDESNVQENPMFLDADNGYYQLCFDSPIRDLGTNVSLQNDDFDIDDDGVTEEEATPDLDEVFRVIDGNGDASCDVDMGAYEYSCPDFDDNGCVDFDSILGWLDTFGDEGDCVHDLNHDGVVDFFDLLPILSLWGPCPCVDEQACGALQEDIDCMGLTARDWSDFVSNAEDENYQCWIDHYWYCHCLETCVGAPSCPGSDPFGGH